MSKKQSAKKEPVEDTASTPVALPERTFIVPEFKIRVQAVDADEAVKKAKKDKQ